VQLRRIAASHLRLAGPEFSGSGTPFPAIGPGPSDPAASPLETSTVAHPGNACRRPRPATRLPAFTPIRRALETVVGIACGRERQTGRQAGNAIPCRKLEDCTVRR